MVKTEILAVREKNLRREMGNAMCRTLQRRSERGQAGKGNRADDYNPATVGWATVAGAREKKTSARCRISCSDEARARSTLNWWPNLKLAAKYLVNIFNRRRARTGGKSSIM